MRSGLRTIALNVTQNNAAAIAVYERLGFTRYCEYREGHARLRFVISLTNCPIPRGR